MNDISVCKIKHFAVVAASLLLITTDGFAQIPDSKPRVIEITAFLNPIDQAAIPAQEQGVLAEIGVKVGQPVMTGESIARVTDTVARLELDRALLDERIATVAADNTFVLESARAQHEEALLSVKQARLARDVAAAVAGNQVAIENARKSHEVANIQYERARKARQSVRTSVSQTEIDRLRIAVEKSELEVRNAQLENTLATMRHQIEASLLEEKTAVAERLKLAIGDAESQHEVTRLTRNRYAAALKLAEARLSRHAITTPIDGTVVEVLPHRGEWVQPGQTIARVIRTDKLYAEGFVDNAESGSSLVGASAKIVFRGSGTTPIEAATTVNFSSPEVDRANRQFKIRAEFDNRDGKFKPGMSVRMRIAVPDM